MTTPKNKSQLQAEKLIAEMKAQAQDWVPDPGPIVLIDDPLQSPVLDVRAQQNSDDPIDEGIELLDDDGSEPVSDPGISFAELQNTSEATSQFTGEVEERADEPEVEFTPVEEMDASLANLTQAMEHEQSKQVEGLEQVAATEIQNAAQLLADQIAEDDQLQAELKAEADEAAATQDEAMEETDPELLAALPKSPETDAEGRLDLREMCSCIETLLFLSDKPISTARLHDMLGPDLDGALFDQAIVELTARYQEIQHGFELIAVGGGFQFRTKPGRAALAKKLAKVQTQRLSTGAMESLAIVAYRQPVLKDEIDKVRGVDSSHFIRGLLDKKLIKIDGRSELPGRPMLYSTTSEFLELFGLADLGSMPSLKELEQMVPTSESSRPGEEVDPRVREMRRLVSDMKNNSDSILNYDPREDDKILKDIRERVQAIPSSTPYLEEQKAREKQAELVKLGDLGAAASALMGAETSITPELPLATEELPIAAPSAEN